MSNNTRNKTNRFNTSMSVKDLGLAILFCGIALPIAVHFDAPSSVFMIAAYGEFIVCREKGRTSCHGIAGHIVQGLLPSD
jgi:hypothetical protein